MIRLLTLIAILTSCSYEQNNIRLSDKSLKDEIICVIGDTGKNSEIQFKVAKKLNSDNCTQIRHVGDIIYPNGIKSKVDPQYKSHFYKYYQKLFENKVPFYMSLGNHDYKESPKAWIEIAKENPLIYFPHYYYAEIYQNLCFITLDTNAYFIEQLLWLNDFYDTNKDKCRSSVFFGHHPLYSSGSHGNAFFGVRLFLNLALKNRAHYYIAGHDHNLEDYGKIEGIQYLISGAAGELRPLSHKSPNWGVSKPGYLKILFSENKIDYNFVVID